MVLAKPKCAPAIILQYLSDGGRLFRYTTMRTRETISTLGNSCITGQVMVPASQQC